MSRSVMHTERHMVFGPPIQPGEPYYSEYHTVVADPRGGMGERHVTVLRRFTCGHYCHPDPSMPPPLWVHGICLCPWCLERTGGQAVCASCWRALNATLPMAYDTDNRLICGVCAEQWIRAIDRPRRFLGLLK